MKTKIEYCSKTYLVSLIFGILIGICCVLYYSAESQYTHIESVIKKHNAIKESLESEGITVVDRENTSIDFMRSKRKSKK